MAKSLKFSLVIGSVDGACHDAEECFAPSVCSISCVSVYLDAS